MIVVPGIRPVKNQPDDVSRRSRLHRGWSANWNGTQPWCRRRGFSEADSRSVCRQAGNRVKTSSYRLFSLSVLTRPRRRSESRPGIVPFRQGGFQTGHLVVQLFGFPFRRPRPRGPLASALTSFPSRHQCHQASGEEAGDKADQHDQENRRRHGEHQRRQIHLHRRAVGEREPDNHDGDGHHDYRGDQLSHSGPSFSPTVAGYRRRDADFPYRPMFMS